MDDRAYRVALSTLTQPLVTTPLYRGNLLEYISRRLKELHKEKESIRTKAIPEKNLSTT